MRDILKEAYMYILGALICAAFFVVVWLLIFNAVPVDNQTLLNIALGALIAKFGDVIAYFFGSSKGSADKTELMNKQDTQP